MKSLILFSFLILTGCELPQNKYGEELTEKAIVFDLCFVPKGHGSDTALGFNMGKGGGLTITPVDIHIPARYAVIFQCQHGKFVIDEKRGESLYKTLSKGESVTIRYCEKIRTYKGKSEIIGLHFIDAIPDEGKKP